MMGLGLLGFIFVMVMGVRGIWGVSDRGWRLLGLELGSMLVSLAFIVAFGSSSSLIGQVGFALGLRLFKDLSIESVP